MLKKQNLQKKEFVKINSAAEFQTEFAKIEETEITTGFHMTMKMEMPEMGFEKFDMNIYYLPGATEDATPTIAAKYDFNMEYEEEMTMAAVGTMYDVDGYTYTDATINMTAAGQTMNYTQKQKAESGTDVVASMVSMYEMYTDLGSILTMMPDFEDLEGVEFYKSTDGTQIKIVVAPGTELDGMVAEQVEMTIEFAEGKVTGFAMVMKATITDGEVIIPMNMEITLTQFAGEIELPSFEGYTEAEGSGFPGLEF